MTMVSKRGCYDITVISFEADRHLLEFDSNGYKRGDHDISPQSIVYYLYRNYTFFNVPSLYYM